MLPLSFRKAAQRLLELGTLRNNEEDLRKFYECAVHLIGRVDCMYRRWNEENKTGHEEWCDFRAQILVSWGMYYDPIWTNGKDPTLYFTRPRENYRPSLEQATELLLEIVK